MRQWSLAVLFSIVASSLASPSKAQEMPAPGPGMALLRNPHVQQELKLDADQVARIEAGIKRIGDETARLMQSARQLSVAERREKMAERLKVVVAENQKLVTEELTPEQLTRLSQIENQVRGWRAFQDPRVQKFLNLSTEQKAKVAAFNTESIETAKALSRAFSDDLETRRVKFQQAQDSIKVRALEMLDGDQQMIWKKLTGEPFDINLLLGSSPPR